MGVDGMSNADIFDEYFDDEYFDNEKPKATSERNFGINNKYVIKNCPAIYGISLDGCKEDHYEDGTVLCQDCSGCVLKQIVELCNGIKCPCEYKGADCWECTESGVRRFADKILRLLDIQEVE